MSKLVGIKKSGVYIPPKVLKNTDLEKLVETSDRWITERTGIKERRIASHNMCTSDLAARALLNCLKNSKFSVRELDALIVATGTPDRLFPSTASRTSYLVKAPESCASFDISAACAGFNYSMDIGASMIESGRYKKVAIIGAEIMSKFINWEDRTTCVLFGDGAGTFILSETKKGYGIIDSMLYTDGKLADFLSIPAGGSLEPLTERTLKQKRNTIHMNGREVFKHAVNNLSKACNEILDRNKLNIKQIDLVISHQANQRIMDSIAKKVGFDKKSLYSNISKYGNTSAASIPIAFHEALMDGKIVRNSIILFMSFGAGFNWGVTLYKHY